MATVSQHYTEGSIRAHSGFRENSFIREALIVAGGSLLVALCARIAIPLPFSPVPLAIQAQVCLLMAVFLGSKRATAIVLAFLAQGVAGLPVFAMGHSGLAVLMGPRGGYLLGYLAAVFLVGYLWERSRVKNASRALLVMGIGNLIIFGLGVAQLSQFIGLNQALLLGVVPFIIGDFLKLLLGAKLVKAFAN
jgi:biotin transport system substrate-specific component